jgi:hypothetical protein
MSDENNQLPNTETSFTLTSNSWGGSVSAWTCNKCGYLIYSGSVHHCPSLPYVGLGGYPPVQFEPERKPHVCPVCTGKGKVYGAASASEGTGEEECPACKGVCVLWG